MRSIDALTLAMTKRRAHKVRTAAVTLVSSLLFIVLFGAAIMLQGLIDSSRGYGSVGWNEHFLTTVQPNVFGGSQTFDAHSQAEREVIAELQKRKVQITDTLKESPEFLEEVGKRMQEKARKQTDSQMTKYEQTLAQFNPSGVYHMQSAMNINPLNDVIAKDADPSLTDAIKQAQKQDVDMGRNMMDRSEAANLSTIEDGLLTEQLSTGQSMAWSPGQPYPIFVPYDTLLKLSGKTRPQASAETIELYRSLIREYQGRTFQYCYRNETAQSQIQQAALYNQELVAQKDTVTKPIALPKCQALDQQALKNADLLPDQQDLTLNPDGTKRLFPAEPAVAPVTRTLTFKIVGFLPFATPSFTGQTSILDSLFFTVGMPPYGFAPAVVPASIVERDTSLKSLFNATSDFPMPPVLFVDFETRTLQKEFLKTSCVDMECANGTKPMISTFGSLSVATESLADVMVTGGLYVVLVLSVIAGLIIMLSIGKVVADSSREIAVFRAIGAQRFDILQIYITYGLMLAGSALVMAFLIAAGVALALSMEYADQVNLAFVRVLGAYESDIKLWFVGFNWLWLGAIAGALLVTSFIGVLLPTLNAVQGRLNNKMREE